MNTGIAQTENAHLPAAFAGLKAGIQNLRQALPDAAADPLLRLDREGIWLYGASNTDVEPGSHWVIDILSLQHGYVCWSNNPSGNNTLLGEVFAPMASAPVDVAKLPNHGQPWKAASKCSVTCVTGEDKGTKVLYKPSSSGGIKAMNALLTSVERELNSGSSALNPVVELKSTSYVNKRYGGNTYNPVLNIVGWFDAGTYAPQVTAAEPDEYPAEVADVEQRPARRDATSAPAEAPATRSRAAAPAVGPAEGTVEVQPADAPIEPVRTRQRRRTR